MDSVNPLPDIPSDPASVAAWVGTHLDGLFGDLPVPSGRYVGGQSRADHALASFDVAGYASQRNEVWPVSRRGASGLSPYIRHGLLQLPRVWDAVADGPSRDVRKFRDELLWQEYSRHLYARLGAATKRGLRFEMGLQALRDDPWPPAMACMNLTVDELETDGWLVNQTRMWLASQWAVRHQVDWREGEDRFFRHLLDGSRAANRVGWQWTAGLITGKAYGFSRWQVEKRAPGLCATCPLQTDCPIGGRPQPTVREPVEVDPRLRTDLELPTTAGPLTPDVRDRPDCVWLTAESLGAADPALLANPSLPVVFVFDEPLLTRLQLSAKRLIFMAQTLAELARHRTVEIHRGRPVEVLTDRAPAVTFTPVPGWRRLEGQLSVAEVHPWPWLRRPHAGSVASFSQWRRGVA